MKVGEKILLWSQQLRHGAYKDQFGIEHSAIVILEEIEVTVTKLVDVKCTWTGEPVEGKGRYAQDANSRVYQQNIEGWPSDSKMPTYYWYSEPADQFEDAFQSVNLKLQYPKIRPDGTLAVPAGAIHCEKHDQYLKPDEQCFYCKHGVDRRR